jgi:Histidine phosphatase superfamily (branch 1)
MPYTGGQAKRKQKREKSMALTRIILVRHGETQANREDRYIGTDDVPLTDGCLRSASSRRICLERSRHRIPLGGCRTASGSGGLEKRFDMFKAKVADAFRKAASRRNISLGRVGETMCEDDATSTSMRDEEGAMYGIQQ